MNKKDLYGDFKKIVQFTDDTKRYADLKIRLHYDGLRQGEFFRSLVIGYLERDEDLMKFLGKMQEKISRYSQSKRNKLKKSDNKRKEAIKKFALDDRDIENIFDLLEKEHPEL
jgi:hypothetical protein|tara:strand:- start:504 stop:842 length:339 start_codon:yes stop_codon:yes gene_type:complete